MTLDWGALITKLLLVLIEILLPYALWKVVAFVNSKKDQVVAAVKQNHLETAILIVERLVRAAEQNGMVGELEKAGVEKKKYVLDRAQAELAKHGITMDLEMLDDLIEAEVSDAFGKIDISLGDLDGSAPAPLTGSAN